MSYELVAKYLQEYNFTLSEETKARLAIVLDNAGKLDVSIPKHIDPLRHASLQDVINFVEGLK